MAAEADAKQAAPPRSRRSGEVPLEQNAVASRLPQPPLHHVQIFRADCSEVSTTFASRHRFLRHITEEPEAQGPWATPSWRAKMRGIWDGRRLPLR